MRAVVTAPGGNVTQEQGDAMKRRLLFVLSSDHGELFNAMYFIRTQPFTVKLLLPPALYDLNRDSLPCASDEYRSWRDVCRAVEREKPDLVLLFSGYLYVINGLLDARSVEHMLDALAAAGVPTVTSDPSNGLLAQMHEGSIEDRRTGRRSLLRHLAWMRARLQDMTHLYAAPPLPGTGPGIDFFNPRMLVAGAPARDASGGGDRGKGASPRLWLFVLSAEDHALQRQASGRLAFARTLAARLRDATAANRHPVLIAPRACLDDVAAVGGAPQEMEALSRCPFERFLSLLLEAEYAFYWNQFSASLVARGINGLPFFAFARGHLAHIMPAFFERASRQFYAGADAPLLDADQRLDPHRLHAAARLQGAALEVARERLMRAPTPQVVVERLLAAAQHTALTPDAPRDGHGNDHG